MSFEMDDDQLKEIIKAAVTEAFSDSSLHCRYTIDPPLHQLQHEAMARFMNLVTRLEDIKWGVFKALAVWGLLTALGLMMYGAAIKIKLLSIIGIVK